MTHQTHNNTQAKPITQGSTMTKRRKTTDTRGPLQRLHDREAADTIQSTLSVITIEQRAKGTYHGERRITNNHDPVARWGAAGSLTEAQKATIGYVRTLWELSGLQQPLTANYGHVVSGGGDSERRAALEIDARKILHRCQDHVTQGQWSVFENVCRWGQPAGVAGEILTRGSARSADIRAHQVVCDVADIVAKKERLT